MAFLSCFGRAVFRGCISILGSLLMLGGTSLAQEARSRVELFAGADVNYRCIMLNERVYDFLIYVTPGVKWHFGNGWLVSAQGAIPVVNQWAEYYKYPKVSIADISRQLNLGAHRLKLSAGLFSNDRYGLDAKWFWPVCDWFALEAQAGLTGYWTMSGDFGFSPMERITGLLSARFWIEPASTEIRITGGRYIYADYGARVEWLRHFSNCVSVGAFVQAGNRYGSVAGGRRWGGGAVFIVMLPWQGKEGRAFKVRPASNFRLTYDYWADPYGMKMYRTDPEENERTGNYSNPGWGFGK